MNKVKEFKPRVVISSSNRQLAIRWPAAVTKQFRNQRRTTSMENELAESLRRHGEILTLEEPIWKLAIFFKKHVLLHPKDTDFMMQK